MSKPEAFCLSVICTSYLDKEQRKLIGKRKLKEVSKGTMECPDCGSILLWVMPKKKYKKKTKTSVDYGFS